MLGAIIGLIIVGLIAGYVARALIPGRQALTLTQTLLLGIAGSFVGGALSWLIFDTDGGLVQAASWLGSIVGATILLGLRVMLEDYRQTSTAHR
jgi:uncharacterized membrane protein YeaQ/YmgE (transglycosylase-associated protein family)